MSIEEDILIQNFLKDTLSDKERNEVLQKMELDESFREKVNFEKQLFLNLNDTEWSIGTNTNHEEVKEYEELLKSESTKILTDTISTVNYKYQLKQNRRGKSWFLYTGIAVVLFLIGLTIFSPFKTSTEELYANYLDVSELPSLVDRGNSEQKALIQAQKLFEAREYNQSLDILEKELSTVQKNKATIYLYMGISQMELGQFVKAEISFNTLIESKFIDAPKGTWYKALLYIKQNNIEKAKELLSEIAKYPNNYKSKEASELLDKL
ncbi:tetratricopeptide repeat protein [uncultured Aquimarina sp.]|uniref:tetratricopeptide repeat protein n=1 Tax=uncultured Aquimarina sp. TaxID=575652 RepID=UPI002609C8F3|nr:tetratricopeptide repeat protein [uncultured Aquimarina sp.]